MNNIPTEQVLEAFNEKLIEIALPQIDCLYPDGEIHRFGERDAGWYQLFDTGVSVEGKYGNWRETEHMDEWPYFNYQYRADATPEEIQAAKEQQEALSREQQERTEQNHKSAQATAQELWGKAEETAEHEYLVLKGFDLEECKKLQAASGFRIVEYPDCGLFGPLLCIPFYSVNGTLHTLEFIDAKGNKRWLKYGVKKGKYHRIKGKAERLYIAEGFSTACSVHLATGCSTIVAGDCGNLLPVAKAIRESLPKIPVTITSDKGNGEDSAKRTADTVGGDIVIPVFPRSAKGSDFNDLMVVSGLQEVTRQLQKKKWKVTWADEIEPRDIQWIWENRLPQGAIAIFAGDPGIGKGRWMDNVFIERLWRSLKYDEVYLKAYDSVAQAKQGIGDWMVFYNQEWRHASLSRMTPDQVYYDLPSGLPIAA